MESLGARPACAPRAHPPSPRDPLARESVKSALGVLIDSSGGLPTGMVPIHSQWPTASTGCRGALEVASAITARTWCQLCGTGLGSCPRTPAAHVDVGTFAFVIWLRSDSAIDAGGSPSCFTMCSKHPYDCKPKVTESGSPFLAMLVFASSSKPGCGGAADMSGFIFAGEIVVAYSLT